MTDYLPSMVYEHEVRNSFSPPLEYDDISKVDILLKIESVEDYITAVYFDDITPSRDDSKVPALLLVMSKVFRGNPALAKKYTDVAELELGDYHITYDMTARGKHVNPYESAKSWEQMAHEILERRGSNTYKWTTPILVNG